MEIWGSLLTYPFGQGASCLGAGSQRHLPANQASISAGVDAIIRIVPGILQMEDWTDYPKSGPPCPHLLQMEGLTDYPRSGSSHVLTSRWSAELPKILRL